MVKKEAKPKFITNKNIYIVIAIVILSVILSFIISKKFPLKTKQSYQTSEEYRLAGNDYYNSGQYAEAIYSFEQAIKLDPNNYHAYLGLGASYRAYGIYDEALKHYKTALKLNDKDYRSYFGLGLAYYEMEDYSNAYTNLLQAHAINPTHKGIISYLINSYNAIGLYDEALKLSSQELNSDPNNSHYYRKIVIAYLMKGDLDKALENAQKAVQLEVNYAPNHLVLGNVYLSLDEGEKSLTEFQKSINLVKGNAGFEGLSLVYYLINDLKKSKEYHEFSLNYPRHSFSLSLLGFGLLYSKKYQKAIEVFEDTIQNTPNYYLPYKGLGKVYLELGDKAKSIKNFEKAASINGLDKESMQILSELKA